MHPVTLRFSNSEFEARFRQSWRQSLISGIDHTVICAQLVLSVIFDSALVAMGHVHSWPVAGFILFVLFVNYLVVYKGRSSDSYCSSRDGYVLAFRAAYLVAALKGLPLWSLHRSHSLLEHVVFAAGNTVLVHLSVVQPVIFTTHIMVQPLMFAVTAWALNGEICHVVSLADQESKQLEATWKLLTRWSNASLAAFMSPVGFIPHAFNRAFQFQPACHSLLLFVQVVVGMLLPTMLVWLSERRWRLDFLRNNAAVTTNNHSWLQRWRHRGMYTAVLLVNGMIGLSVCWHLINVLATVFNP